jgi:hypothetical protein
MRLQSGSGHFVYVTVFFASNILAYRVGEDGTLTPVAGSPFLARSDSRSVAFSP